MKIQTTKQNRRKTKHKIKQKKGRKNTKNKKNKKVK